MSNGLLALAMGLAMQVGSPGPSENPYTPPLTNAYGQYGHEGSQEQRFPFDTQRNWVHGYYQELPTFHGHPFYRPYNYKHVLSQAQTAAGWGERPMMPYSQQYWHKYHDQATMLKPITYVPTYLPPRQPSFWTPTNWQVTQQQQQQQSFSQNTLSQPAGFDLQSESLGFDSPYHAPPQNSGGYVDRSRILMPPAIDTVNPAAYQLNNSRSNNGRGY